ncbi:pyridoxamine 5'-phosphate oxidase family protein [Leisingera sp. HS039]|uniref:pyridoxamine 5'-phosphate oxidase family protein n=1 Tax=unclassified Leisingera TaxID=2614906 RepID=UPI001071315F|nr:MULTISPECIES: pyridoxamine 5'-phosphate oxidase family protein [unclassified Leisingera]MBQ4825203.1 pyridoxamine 5'-phosphate oxidase family protein [Leisingera sp. HS039]QBR35048.1 pyridoxamine 5'-phosphate oxidase family protein [Leisingera sp. NJS201]
MSQSEVETALKSERSRLRRAHERGVYDREAVYQVLDAMPLGHIGYQIDGSTSVLPTLQWREGDHVYWHGSAASRAIRAMEGAEVCLTVTCMDGYVLARSAFHHSVNFRSAMLFGVAEKVTDEDAKAASLKTMVDHIFPGRWEALRPMTSQELKATALLRMPIEEGAAKVRSGPPKDDEEDYALPIWAGVVPMALELKPPQPDPANLEGVAMPDHLSRIRIG